VKSSHHAPAAPRCIIIAGPNGAGKTTFAREFLPKETEIVHFVNADAIAAGLSALKPEIVAVAAARIFLVELDRLAASRTSFAFETTFSGRAYVKRLVPWKAFDYRIEIVYLKILSPQIALKRIAARVKQGGHDVASADVLRRFGRSWKNFVAIYRPLADAWAVYDNSGVEPRLLEQSP
jgi:predicted ABC-type ATPase